MNKLKIELPEKIFGIESAVLVEYIPLLGLLLIFLVSWSWLFSPKLDQISQTRSKITQVENETKLVKSKSNYLRSVDQEELNKSSELLANSLIKEKNSYYLVGVVKQLAIKNGFAVSSFVVSPGRLGDKKEEEEVVISKSKKKSAKNDSGLLALPVTMTLNGPAQNYDKFIFDIERSIPVLSIGSLEMKQGGGAMVMDLTVTAYYASDRSDVNLTKLSLNDLALTEDEESLLKTLADYSVIAKAGSLEGEEKQKDEFVKYGKDNPFSL